jgi:hypothetical protein
MVGRIKGPSGIKSNHNRYRLCHQPERQADTSIRGFPQQRGYHRLVKPSFDLKKTTDSQIR